MKRFHIKAKFPASPEKLKDVITVPAFLLGDNCW